MPAPQLTIGFKGVAIPNRLKTASRVRAVRRRLMTVIRRVQMPKAYKTATKADRLLPPRRRALSPLRKPSWNVVELIFPRMPCVRRAVAIGVVASQAELMSFCAKFLNPSFSLWRISAMWSK